MARRVVSPKRPTKTTASAWPERMRAPERGIVGGESTTTKSKSCVKEMSRDCILSEEIRSAGLETAAPPLVTKRFGTAAMFAVASFNGPALASTWLRPIFGCRSNVIASDGLRRSASIKHVLPRWARIFARLIATVVFPSFADGEDTRTTRGAASGFEYISVVRRLCIDSASAVRGPASVFPLAPLGDPPETRPATGRRGRISVGSDRAILGSIARDGIPVHLSRPSGVWAVLSKLSRTKARKKRKHSAEYSA